jgi:hypothetical protein
MMLPVPFAEDSLINLIQFFDVWESPFFIIFHEVDIQAALFRQWIALSTTELIDFALYFH